MGDIADMMLDGILDEQTGEYLGKGVGYPRTLQMSRKSQDLSWKKVVAYMINMGIKPHLHPQILKDYGCNYSGKKPLRNACFEILKDFERFKNYLKTI